MERKCTFVVMANTGEKPDVEIHSVGFTEDDGIACVSKIEGGMGDVIKLICSLVEHIGSDLKEEGTIKAAMFVDMVGDALTKGCGLDAIQMAKDMSDPKKAIKLIIGELEKLVEGDE